MASTDPPERDPTRTPGAGDRPSSVRPVQQTGATRPVEPPPATGPDAPAPVTETRRERARRHRQRTRLYLWAILGVVVLGLIITWVVQNRETIEVDWVVGSTDAALALVIFVAAALGWLLGLATAVLIRRRTRPPAPPRKQR